MKAKLTNVLKVAIATSLLTGPLGIGMYPTAAAESLNVVEVAGAGVDSINYLAAEYQKKTGIVVHVTIEGYANLRDKLMTSFMAHSAAYDAVDIAYQWVGGFVKIGALEPLDSYVAGKPGLLDPFIPAVTDTFRFNSKLYGLPWQATAPILFYRTDLLADAGIKPPVTVDDYDAIGKAFLHNPKYPGVYGMSIMGVKTQALTLWSHRYWALGGGPIGTDKEGKIKLDIEKAIKALEILKTEITQYSPPGALNAGIPEVDAQFVAGQVVALETFANTIATQIITPGSTNKVLGKVATTLVPGGHSQAGNWAYAVPAASKKKQAALDFIAWVTSPENGILTAAKFGKSPVCSASFTSPELSTLSFILPTQLEALRNSLARDNGPDATKINNTFDDLLSRFIAGQIPTAAATFDELRKALPGVVE
jgi:multiple sugar transport system substrate-binding protein